MRRRVVVTGLGVVCPLGCTLADFWANILASKSGIGTISRWDASDFPVHIGGEVRGFDLATYGYDPREAKRLDRFCQFGMGAAISAVRDSGLDFSKEDSFRCGVIVGSGVGGIETLEEQTKVLNDRGIRRVSPFTVPMLMGNAASGNISIFLGLNGPNMAITTACATGNHSLGEAFRLIQHDYADVMVAGGAEAALCRIGLGSFAAARAVSTRNDAPEKASRPFDRDRDGFVMSEGSGIVILEEYEHAKKRGAKIYGEFAGYGMSGDASHITAPDPEGRGARHSMSMSLRDAGLDTTAVDYINAHGTSTPLGDIAETKAVKLLFGEHAKKLTMSSTKSQVGHLLGAAGGVEAVATLLGMVNSVMPPTINLDNADPECDLDYVANTPRQAKINVAMSNSFGFGGHNASLVFKQV